MQTDSPGVDSSPGGPQVEAAVTLQFLFCRELCSEPGDALTNLQESLTSLEVDEHPVIALLLFLGIFIC